MKNVWTIKLGPAGFCLKRSIWSHDQAVPRIAASEFLLGQFNACARPQCTRSRPFSSRRSPCPTQGISSLEPPASSQTKRALHQSAILQRLKPYKGKAVQVEQGLRFQPKELTGYELQDVFGDAAPPTHFANRLLRVLHGRRVDGTLDLEPPQDILKELDSYPDAVADALAWLRDNFPIDEEDAIERRIAREEAAIEQENPSALQQRAEDLGLYKPQSGKYQAKLSEREGDVFGQSALEALRAENIAKAEKEEEELEAQISQIQAEVIAKSEATSLTEQGERGVEVARDAVPVPNEFDKWVLRAKNRAGTKLTLESPEVVNMTPIQRLLPSFIFAVIVSGLSYFFAQYWVPPKRSERIMQDTSLSFATVAAIFAGNIFIYWLWRVPPAWRILNKYFVSVPGQPKALSMLGNVFSHQGIYHLCINMGWMFLLGLSLHEDVGRGTFMGIYVAAGVLSSFASLANFVARGIFSTSSIGASGAVSGIVAAYCAIHATDKFTFGLFSKEWQDKVQFQGWMFMAVMLISQVFGYFSPLKSIDYASHIAGYVVGGVCGWWWKSNQDERAMKARQRARQEPWFEKWFGKRVGSVEDQERRVKDLAWK